MRYGEDINDIIKNLSPKARQSVLAQLGETEQPKKNKYNARKVWLDGIAFDSQKEADYYSELKLLAKAGAIDGFTYHGNIVVIAGSKSEQRGSVYETDFIVFKDGQYEIVETKGYWTDTAKLKQKALREKYPKLKIKVK